jgi:predicted nucleic acid-binding protein
VADRFVILVDTDVLIAHLRGVAHAYEWLKQTRQSGQLAISALTVTELTGGMRSAERRQVWLLLASLGVEPVTELVGRRAGELMRHHRHSHPGIGLADYVIAATAQVKGFTLATLNVRHFPMFPDLQAPFRLDG